MQEKLKKEKENLNVRFLPILKKIMLSMKHGLSITITSWANKQEVKKQINQIIDSNIPVGFSVQDKQLRNAAYIDAALGHGYSPKELANFSFMRFYSLLKDIVCHDKQSTVEKRESLQQFRLDSPYELAKEYFKIYVQGLVNRAENAKINIHDLFTYNDLIELGGCEFIKDCYEKINDLKLEINNKNLVEGAQRENQKNKEAKEEENRRAKEEENRRAKESAEKQEKKLKHFVIGELKTLPFTAILAIAVGLTAFFGFGVSDVLLLSLIGSPIVFSAVVIGPYVGWKNRRSAINAFVQKIQTESEQNLDSKSNLNLNDKLKQKKVEYEEYKQKQQKKGNDGNSKNSEIEKIKPLKIVNEKKQANPLQVINNKGDKSKVEGVMGNENRDDNN